MTIFHGQKINCGLPTIKLKFAAMDEININDSNLENSELTPLQQEYAEGNAESNNTQLILVPLPIGENSWLWMNTPQYIDSITPIRHWVAEDARTLRRFLSSLKVGIPLNDLDIFELNTRTPQKELEAFLKDIQNTKLIGMASEAGMPCIADPGAMLVKIGHQRGWDIKPIMGPNSLMLALAGSGLSGQTFTFHGYPPINENELKQLTVLLNNKATDKHSHLFIETPYRTDRLLQFFCKNLPQDMLLCIAKDLQGPAEHILTQTISAWKRKVETLGKSPCVFIVGR
jgi:16S rRNA (cytidine1402-2'-O)-methyltransferase